MVSSAGVAALALIGLSSVALAGLPMSPVNDRPNPYQTGDNFLKMPAGRTWGGTAGIDIAPDGKSVWALDRCGGNGSFLIQIRLGSAALPQQEAVRRIRTVSSMVTKSYGSGCSAMYQSRKSYRSRGERGNS